MKRTISRVIAAVAVFSMALGTVIGCGPEEQPGGNENGNKTVAVTGVSLNKTSLSLTEGGSESLTATVTPDNATNKNVSWKSSDASVASVDNSGKVTAVKAGSATITVTTTDGSKTATCSVTVAAKAVAVTGVKLDKGEVEITKGESVQLAATISPDNATDKSMTWTSSDENVAKVDNTGKITAVDAGTATITVKTTDGGKTATCSVKVNPKEVPVEGVSIEPATLEITEGETYQLKASVSPADADQEVEWTAQNSQIATVDGNGLVTAVKPGNTRIIVRSKTDIDQQGYCEVTVKQDQSLKGITIDASEINLSVGGSRTLGVVYIPEYAANKNVTWASSNPTVATVTEGKVVALSEGTTTITATSEEGGFKAECKVTVSKAEGPFVYYGTDWNLYVNGEPDPLSGVYAPDGYKFSAVKSVCADGSDLYSYEGFQWGRDWFCKNRKPVVNLFEFEEYDSRLNFRSFSARNGVFAILYDIGQYNFEIIRASENGDIKHVTVHTPASNLNEVSMAVAPNGDVHAAAHLRDSFGADCLYWYKIAPDGKVTEKLVEKINHMNPRVAISDAGDVYFFGRKENGGAGSESGRLYKNGKFLMDIDKVENNFQSALACSGNNVYTAIADLQKKEIRVHKDGKQLFTITNNGKGASLGFSFYNRMWVTSNGDVYLGWNDDNYVSYLSKNDKVIYTSSEDTYYTFCVVE